MKRFFVVLALIGGLLTALPVPTTYAKDLIGDACNEAKGGNASDPTVSNTATCSPQSASTSDPTAVAKTVVDVLLLILGMISVIMIVVGGFRYVVSSGDKAAVTSAKNTILYAVVGLVIALLAYAIVSFVVNQVK